MSTTVASRLALHSRSKARRLACLAFWLGHRDEPVTTSAGPSHIRALVSARYYLVGEPCPRLLLLAGSSVEDGKQSPGERCVTATPCLSARGSELGGFLRLLDPYRSQGNGSASSTDSAWIS